MNLASQLKTVTVFDNLHSLVFAFLIIILSMTATVSVIIKVMFTVSSLTQLPVMCVK